MDVEEETLAYHEAGHAIMAVICGGTVDRVSLQPEEQSHEGDTIVRWSAASGRAHALREIRVSLAGPISEMIYVGEYDCLRIKAAHAMDWGVAMESVQKLSGNVDHQRKLIQQEASEIYDLMRQDHVWAAIAALTDELLAHETVGGDTVDAIADYWIP